MSVVKAFLSHSSKDRQLVKAVSEELTRQYCIVDEQAFLTGDEFKESIEDSLDKSSIFVLFASKDSLLSDWVSFEIEETWYRKLEGKLSKSLVYLIDDSVNVDQLPRWLQRTKIQRGHVPKVIAREIRAHIDKLQEERKNPFLGRSQDVQKLEEALTPVDGSPSPHVFFVTGLMGIGRRSLVQKVVPEVLDLRLTLEPIRLGEGFSIQDICSYVADSVEPYSTDEGFRKLMAEIQNLSNDFALERTMNNLRRITSNSELPLFLDEGGLFDSDGNISASIQSMISALLQNDEAYIAFISNRRPPRDFNSIAKVHLESLTIEDCKLLIGTLDRRAIRTGRRTEALKPNEISELASYTAGYPPSAYAAIEKIEDYGIDVVMADKSRFVELRINQFFDQLVRQKFSGLDREVLSLLSNFSPLPLHIIALTLSQEVKTIGNVISKLIDLSFVTVENRVYRIADPIEDAAVKAFGLLSLVKLKALANHLINLIDDPYFEDHRLNLHRILFRVAWITKDSKIKDRAFHLFNDLIQTIKSLYNIKRSYEDVVETADLALLQCRNKSDHELIRTYKIKALIQLRKWEQAEEEIEQLKQYAPIRDVYYLQGFLNRKRGRTTEAIRCYTESRNCGRKGESLDRELGQCYYLEGDYQNANLYAKRVLDNQRQHRRVNIYSLDLQIQIAMAIRDQETAWSAIKQLEEIDKVDFFYRKSRFEFFFGSKEQAKQDSLEAMNFSGENPRFQTISHMAFCYIALGEIKSAEETLKLIDQRFGNVYRDICCGLRARLAISRSYYSDALNLSNEIKDKSTKAYKGIRRDALRGFLTGCNFVEDDERHKLGEELKQLDIELVNVSETELTPEVDMYIDID